MGRRKKTDLRTAALVIEMKKSEGRTERQIAAATGLPRSTVHTIVSGAHGWAEVAEGQLFKRYRDEQNKALEQVYRTMTAEALKKAYGKMSKASYYQLVCSAGIMTDKYRLLAGESTQNIEVHNKHEIEGLDKLSELLSQRLLSTEKPAIDVTPVPQDSTPNKS
jgi:predicted transcriptional regulator